MKTPNCNCIKMCKIIPRRLVMVGISPLINVHYRIVDSASEYEFVVHGDCEHNFCSQCGKAYIETPDFIYQPQGGNIVV